MGVSKNNGTPKSSILIGFSIINHPFWGTTIFGNTHIHVFLVRHSQSLVLLFALKKDGPSADSNPYGAIRIRGKSGRFVIHWAFVSCTFKSAKFTPRFKMFNPPNMFFAILKDGWFLHPFFLVTKKVTDSNLILIKNHAQNSRGPCLVLVMADVVVPWWCLVGPIRIALSHGAICEDQDPRCGSEG